MHLQNSDLVQKNKKSKRLVFKEVSLPAFLSCIDHYLEDYSNICKPQFAQPLNDNNYRCFMK